jgi:hypothetical protein
MRLFARLLGKDAMRKARHFSGVSFTSKKGQSAFTT